MEQLDVVTGFSGAGGADLTFINDPAFNVKGFTEVDNHASAVLNFHHPTIPNFGDIRKKRPEDYPSMDVYVAGFPCQGVSFQGSMTGLNHPQTGLFNCIPPIIAYHKPKYVILENVNALFSAKMEEVLKHVKQSICKLGYKVGQKSVDSSNYGTPQQRVRAVLFFVRKDIKQDRPRGPLYGGPKSVQVETFEGLDSNCRYVSYSKSTRKMHYDYRIREDGMINTLTTGRGCKGASTGTIVIDKDNNVRDLLPTECEALQTWPKDYTKIGLREDGTTYHIPIGNRYKMCGNGVVSNIMIPFKNMIKEIEGYEIF